MGTHDPAAATTCEVPVFYATTEGQTRRIAERLAEVLRDHGRDSRAFEITSPEAQAIDWSRARGALLGASIHAQWHQKEAYAFVKANVAHLNRLPSAFFSVSLSAASQNPAEQEAARRLANAFPDVNEWRPAMILSLAGRLAYTRYGFIKRRIMTRVARKEGAPTDTSRDYEFTDWNQVERFALAINGLITARANGSAAA
jgi:menaquinone-dependent protoporphyrinogen oxidase